MKHSGVLIEPFGQFQQCSRLLAYPPGYSTDFPSVGSLAFANSLFQPLKVDKSTLPFFTQQRFDFNLFEVVHSNNIYNIEIDWGRYEAVIILAVAITGAIIALFALDLLQSRLYIDRFVGSVTKWRRRFFLSILFLSVIAIMVYVFTDRLDTIIAIYFGVLGIYGGAYFALKPSFEQRTVCIISKSGNNFTRSLILACRRQLESETGIIVREIPINAATPFDEDSHSQENAIWSHDALSSDAIILVPAITTPELTERVVQLQKMGIYIVICDHKISSQPFFENNIFPPSLVTADFVRGGALIGHEIAAQSTNPQEPIIVLKGPSFSGPGTLRSDACIRELVKAGKLDNMHFLELVTWNPSDSASLFMDFVSNELPRKAQLTDSQDISVFCGNDEICRQIDRLLSNTNTIPAYKWKLFGYDGIKDNSGTYVLESCRYVLATIDQKIEALGIQTANILIDKYRGINNVRRRKSVVPPELITFDAKHSAIAPPIIRQVPTTPDKAPIGKRIARFLGLADK